MSNNKADLANMFYYVKEDNSIHRHADVDVDTERSQAVPRSELVHIVQELCPGMIPSHSSIVRPDYIKSDTDQKNYTRRQRYRCARSIVLDALKSTGERVRA